MSRECLPNRRSAETFDFEISGLHYTCTIGRYSDGRLAEIFLQNTKAGSQSDGNARESAIAASLALQFGCPAETLRGAVLRNPNGTACTPLGAALDQIAGFQKVQLSAKEV
jgi:ribonucleoside-diphosphate reductase alpha chain